MKSKNANGVNLNSLWNDSRIGPKEQFVPSI